MSWDWLFAYDYLIDIGISIGISIGIFLLFLIFRKLFTKYVFALLLKFGRKVPSEWFSQVLLAFEKPVQSLFLIIGLYVSASYFPYFDETNTLFANIMKSAIIALIGWGLFNLSSSSSVLFSKFNDRYNLKVDDIIIPFFSKFLRFVVVAISLSVILQVFGYKISGLVAGLGLGGLAISLAAKDALANLFGGVVIITEKPFSIGDWIKTPTVEGIVEDITFRSTLIRTFADALVTVPNATLANESITNWSKMGKRQITFNLRVTHDTTQNQLKNVVNRIQSLLKNHDDIHQETIFVSFDEYKENGLDIFLYFFTKTTNWGEYLKVREEVNFAIMDILKDEGVEFALPTTRFYVDSAQKRDVGGEISGGNEGA